MASFGPQIKSDGAEGRDIMQRFEVGPRGGPGQQRSSVALGAGQICVEERANCPLRSRRSLSRRLLFLPGPIQAQTNLAAGGSFEAPPVSACAMYKVGWRTAAPWGRRWFFAVLPTGHALQRLADHKTTMVRLRKLSRGYLSEVNTQIQGLEVR